MIAYNNNEKNRDYSKFYTRQSQSQHMNNIKNTLVQQQKIIYLKEWKHIKVTLEEYKTENKDALSEKKI